MDKKSVKKRLKSTNGKSDDTIAMDYVEVVGKRFPKVKNNGLQYLFLDAQFDEDDDDEVKAFEEAMEKLYGMIEAHDGLLTNKINEEVESENGKLKRELAAREKDKIEFTKKLQAINDDMKKAEENRAKVEKQMEDALKEADENRDKMEKQMEDLKKESADKIEPEELQAMIDALKKAEEDRAKVEKKMEDALKKAEENRAKVEKQMEDLKEECADRRGGNFLTDIAQALTGGNIIKWIKTKLRIG